MTPFRPIAADSHCEDRAEKSAGTLTGKLDGTNSTLMQALTDTRKNLADYQNALKDFQATVKDSGSLIDDTLKTLDSVNAVASSGSAASCRFISICLPPAGQQSEPFPQNFLPACQMAKHF